MRAPEASCGSSLPTSTILRILLPALAARRVITEEDAVTLLTEMREDEINSSRVRSRLKWLAGLGLGSLRGTRLRLSKDGQALIDEIVREAKIQEHDKHNEEAAKRSRYFSVRENHRRQQVGGSRQATRSRPSCRTPSSSQAIHKLPVLNHRCTGTANRHGLRDFRAYQQLREDPQHRGPDGRENVVANVQSSRAAK